MRWATAWLVQHADTDDRGIPTFVSFMTELALSEAEGCFTLSFSVRVWIRLVVLIILNRQ
jgi:hypothetical protein